MKIRRGRRNPHTMYLQIGDQPADNDPCIGFMLDPEYSSLLCEMATSPWHLNEMALIAETRAETER